MAQFTMCMECKYCNKKRENAQGKVRCTRYSRFVDPNQESCDGFYNEDYYNKKHFALYDETIGRW